MPGAGQVQKTPKRVPMELTSPQMDWARACIDVLRGEQQGREGTAGRCLALLRLGVHHRLAHPRQRRVLVPVRSIHLRLALRCALEH